MPVSEQSVLVAVVQRYDNTGEPLSTAAVAARTDGDDDAVAAALERLAASEFLVETATGYRPTVTAREFLALDIEVDDIVAVAVVEE
jgi:predicted transcriptional regulator